MEKEEEEEGGKWDSGRVLNEGNGMQGEASNVRYIV